MYFIRLLFSRHNAVGVLHSVNFPLNKELTDKVFDLAPETYNKAQAVNRGRKLYKQGKKSRALCAENLAGFVVYSMIPSNSTSPEHLNVEHLYCDTKYVGCSVDLIGYNGVVSNYHANN